MSVLGALELLVLAGVLANMPALFQALGWMPVAAPPAGAVAVAAGLMLAMMIAVGLYHWTVMQDPIDLIGRLAAAFGLALVADAAVSYLAPGLRVDPDHLLVGGGIAFLLLLAVRMAFLALARQGRLQPRILLVGRGQPLEQVRELAGQGRLRGYQVADVIQIEKSRNTPPRAQEVPRDLARYARAQAIDEIVLADDVDLAELPPEPLIEARLGGFQVSDYQTFCERCLGVVDLDHLQPRWFLVSGGFRTGAVNRALKRGLDLCVAVAVLVLSAPICVVTALAIKLESRGPIFYKQQRTGLGGAPFTLIKFRSMHQGAETSDQPQWASRGDPRVTRVGAVIRQARIDEIPQAINVLRGDMSFVGPRPERPELVEMLSAEIPYFHYRHAVKPGITGWAQLNYPYGASVEDAKRKLEHDLFYIKYLSLAFDLLIVLQTVRVVLWSQGAR
jgi:sugar transferase (PEP-CTERM system associated)